MYRSVNLAVFCAVKSFFLIVQNTAKWGSSKIDKLRPNDDGSARRAGTRAACMYHHSILPQSMQNVQLGAMIKGNLQPRHGV